MRSDPDDDMALDASGDQAPDDDFDADGDDDAPSAADDVVDEDTDLPDTRRLSAASGDDMIHSDARRAIEALRESRRLQAELDDFDFDG